ncbi:MAG TPA: hypothetical protein VK640_15915 [Actinomycetes bacterium]|nr:hypothetical protein [Actinomycetes bacterium]
MSRGGRGGSVWKLLGLAGVVGIAATGAAVARAERRRRAYTPEEIRERLQARHAETEGQNALGDGPRDE